MIGLPDNDPAEHRRGLVREPLREAEIAERDRRVRIVNKERPEPAHVGRDLSGDSHLERPGESLYRAVVGVQRGQTPRVPQGLRRIASAQGALHGDPQRRLVVWLVPEEPLDLRPGRPDVAGLEERLGEDEPGRPVPRVTLQPLTAERHCLVGPTGSTVRLGQRRIGLGGGLPGQPRLEVSDLVGGRHAMSRPGPSRPSLYGRRSELVNVGGAQTRVAPSVPAPLTIVGPRDARRYSGAMLWATRRLVAIGTGVALATTLGGLALGGSAEPRAYLIYLIDGGDPIVVKKYTEDGGRIRFEKFGGWVEIQSYEVLRVVPDDSDDRAPTAAVPPQTEASDAPFYVATQSGATIRATNVGTIGSEVRVSTHEGSLTFHRADLVGVLRVPAGPGTPEAWITLWGAEDGSGAVGGEPPAGPSSGPHVASPSLTDRPHLLQLANGVVVQVDGFWVEAGEIRFRRLGGVVGFALSEVARLLPQEVEPVGGRLAARFVRQLGPDRLEVRVGQGVQRIHLIGIEAVPGDRALEDPWATLERGLLVHLEFDRERYVRDGDWLAYVYLPNGRMLNAELIRVGLARPRAEAYNIRYLDLFQEIASQPR